jgi:hypothetical protein
MVGHARRTPKGYSLEQQMRDSVREIEIKSKSKWHQPKLIEIHYPWTFTKTRDRHRWIEAMMLDRRLTERTRLILSRLALHLNLNTGRCDPSTGLLAMEVSLRGSYDVAERMVRRSLAQAENIGWIRRVRRQGGEKRWSQTNSYDLTVPPDIAAALKLTTGQIENYARTNRPSPPGLGSPTNTERGIGKIEYSVLCTATVATATRGDEREPNKQDERKGTSEEEEQVAQSGHPHSWVGYTENEIETVQDIIDCYDIDTVSAIVACARTFQNNSITGNVIGMMCRDGHFERDGDRIFPRRKTERNESALLPRE